MALEVASVRRIASVGAQRRRGVLAGAAAVAAAVLAKASEQVARAANGDPVLQGVVNGPYDGTTGLDRVGGAITLPALTVTNDNGDGVDAFGAGLGSIGVFAQDPDGVAALSGSSTSGDGVDGFTTTGIGVFGSTDTGPVAVSGTALGGAGDGVQGFSAGGFGVFGSTTTGTAAVNGTTGGAGDGVAGTATGAGTGVRGTAASGIGVLGTTTTGPAAIRGTNTGALDGVVGSATSGDAVAGTATSGNGVHGTSATKDGVFGQSTDGQGVRGFSTNANGVLGQGRAGVIGFSSVGEAIYGVALAPAAFAGYFSGKVFVGGDLFVTGQFSRSAGASTAVSHPDGSYRQMFSVDAPDDLFEDVGAIRLVDGKAAVTLDPVFKDLIEEGYHVFLTPYGETNGLFVANRTSLGFEVYEANGGKHSVDVSYRVLGKRRGADVKRLQRVSVPDRGSVAAPTPPAPPTDRAVSQAPDVPARQSITRQPPVRQRPVRNPARAGQPRPAPVPPSNGRPSPSR